jgi:hypothetical protein
MNPRSVFGVRGFVALGCADLFARIYSRSAGDLEVATLTGRIYRIELILFGFTVLG